MDDNEIVRWAIEAGLSGRGYAVELAQGAREAFAAMRTARFDLILLDINMPDLDGFSTIEAIRREQLADATPIVFLTGSDVKSDVGRARSLGALGFVSKGEGTKKLLAHIDELFRRPDTRWFDEHHRLITEPKDASSSMSATMSSRL